MTTSMPKNAGVRRGEPGHLCHTVTTIRRMTFLKPIGIFFPNGFRAMRRNHSFLHMPTTAGIPVSINNQFPCFAGFYCCIDTGCGFGGSLTAMDVSNNTCWQVDEDGTKVGPDPCVSMA